MYARVEHDYLDDLEDTELIARWKRGDDSAIEVLLRRHADALFRFCCRLVPNREDAEDICQESMARAITRVDSLRAGSAFRGWLFSIARNLSVDAFRTRKRVLPMPEDELTLLPSHGDSPQDRVEVGEEYETVARALARLTQSHRRVLMLREVEGLSYSEIASRLDTSQSAVETLLFRARRRLREEYGKTAAIPGIALLGSLREIALRLAAPVVSAPATVVKVGVTAAVLSGAAVSTGHVPTIHQAIQHDPTSRLAAAVPVRSSRHSDQSLAATSAQSAQTGSVPAAPVVHIAIQGQVAGTRPDRKSSAVQSTTTQNASVTSHHASAASQRASSVPAASKKPAGRRSGVGTTAPARLKGVATPHAWVSAPAQSAASAQQSAYTQSATQQSAAAPVPPQGSSIPAISQPSTRAPWTPSQGAATVGTAPRQNVAPSHVAPHRGSAAGAMHALRGRASAARPMGRQHPKTHESGKGAGSAGPQRAHLSSLHGRSGAPRGATSARPTGTGVRYGASRTRGSGTRSHGRSGMGSATPGSSSQSHVGGGIVRPSSSRHGKAHGAQASRVNGHVGISASRGSSSPATATPAAASASPASVPAKHGPRITAPRSPTSGRHAGVKGSKSTSPATTAVSSPSSSPRSHGARQAAPGQSRASASSVPATQSTSIIPAMQVQPGTAQPPTPMPAPVTPTGVDPSAVTAPHMPPGRQRGQGGAQPAGAVPAVSVRPPTTAQQTEAPDSVAPKGARGKGRH